MTSVFHSKVDGKLRAVGLLLLCAALAGVVAGPRFALAVLWLPVALVIPVALIVIWVLLSTYYEFQDDVLIAHSGPVRWRVPLRQICGVCESHSVRSGPGATDFAPGQDRVSDGVAPAGAAVGAVMRSILMRKMAAAHAISARNHRWRRRRTLPACRSPRRYPLMGRCI
jgi:hypothetical protein